MPASYSNLLPLTSHSLPPNKKGTSLSFQLSLLLLANVKIYIGINVRIRLLASITTHDNKRLAPPEATEAVASVWTGLAGLGPAGNCRQCPAGRQAGGWARPLHTGTQGNLTPCPRLT